MSTHREPARAGRAAAADENHADRARHGNDDEISLRELYLILRRGLPSILAVAAAAGLVAVLWWWTRPDVFEAEATVVSSPTAVQLQDEGTIRFEPNSGIAFETYEDLATSRATLEATLVALGEEGRSLEGFRQLQRATELELLTGPTNTTAAAPLTVLHRVRWGDPEAAARFADAWAASTVEQVRNTLLADLDLARTTTNATIAARQEVLTEAEEAWRSFLETDASGLELRLSGLESRITQADASVANLNRELAAALGRREVLMAQVEGSADTDEALSEETLDLLEGAGDLDPQVASRLRLLATEVPAGEGLASDATRLLARTDLQRENVQLASLLQERDHVRATRQGYEDEAARLRERLAELRTQGLRAERRLATAQSAYDSVVAIEPLLTFVADLTPGNTRILNEAQVSGEPVRPSLLLIAVLAASVAAMAATVFVFLREAVREPVRTV